MFIYIYISLYDANKSEPKISSGHYGSPFGLRIKMQRPGTSFCATTKSLDLFHWIFRHVHRKYSRGSQAVWGPSVGELAALHSQESQDSSTTILFRETQSWSREKKWSFWPVRHARSCLNVPQFAPKICYINSPDYHPINQVRYAKLMKTHYVQTIFLWKPQFFSKSTFIPLWQTSTFIKSPNFSSSRARSPLGASFPCHPSTSLPAAAWLTGQWHPHHLRKGIINKGVCVCACVCVYVYVFMYVYIYIHIPMCTLYIRI